MSARRSALAAAIVVLGLVGAGCSGDPPKPKPQQSSAAASSASSGTASASPSAPSNTSTSADSAPTMPAAAKERSAAAAEAFARYYVDLINYAMHTGDTDPVRRLARDSCATCKSIAEGIEDIYRGHGRIKRGAWKTKGADSLGPRVHGVTRLRLRVLITRQVVVESPGAQPSTSVPNDGTLDFYISPSTPAWRVLHLVAK